MSSTENGAATQVPLRIFVQSTPNPEALKFVLNRDVIQEGKATYHRDQDTDQNILARDLLNLSGVEQIHFFENVITVTKKGPLWSDLQPLVQSVIETRFPVHKIDFGAQTKVKKKQYESPDLQKIDEILDRTIRPGLQGDGGDLELVSKDGDILKIRYEGACGSCPSATQGTLYAIEDILRREYDPNIQIEPI